MRVLVACDWFLKYAASQASALARAGAEVELLCRTHALEFGGSSKERARVLDQLAGVSCRELPGRISSPRSVGHVIRLRRDIHARAPDIVHAHDNTDPRLLAIVAGLTRVVTVHDPVPHPGQPTLSRIEGGVRRRWVTGSAAVVVHGRALASELPPWMRARPVRSIPHGTAVAASPLPVPEAPAVLLFGRLEPYKGVDVLVRAMQHVWMQRKDVKLVVAGVGPAADLVPRDSRIEVRREYVPEDEIDTLFGAATLAVLPYVQASQSGVGGLALGRGVPTVVSNVGALSELALDESFVVPPGDDIALAQAILTHLDHDEGLRETVLEFARSRLSWDACAVESLELYEAVLDDRR